MTLSEKYLEYIASPQWRKKKEAFKKSKHFKNGCFVCGSNKVDIHHKTYKRFGAERLPDLVALCRACHDTIHEMIRHGGYHTKHLRWVVVVKYKRLFDKSHPDLSAVKKFRKRRRRKKSQDIFDRSEKALDISIDELVGR